jgi:7,8-dihydropterin-6-yl-methyl-4-(beta-D-ribofuranosyl)aminobenzene 5'-phosphate synthase
LAAACFTPTATADELATAHHVHALKITVLVTNVGGDAHAGDGEWGYSALVEVDGHRILYDTGSSADLVLRNARALHVDLSNVDDVILSHNHFDHVGGLMALRHEFAGANPHAMSRVHVGARIFEPRLDESGEDQNGLRLIRTQYLATGGEFIVHDKPTELFPGVWFTGPVPRPNPEKNWNPGLWLVTARTISGDQRLLAVVGGLHLFAASDQTLAWTGDKLKTYQIRNLLAGHCTGIEATFRLRQSTGLDRKTAVVSAVGSSFTLGVGIDPRRLAQRRAVRPVSNTC